MLLTVWTHPSWAGCLGKGALDMRGGGKNANFALTSVPWPTCQQVHGLQWAMTPKHRGRCEHHLEGVPELCRLQQALAAPGEGRVSGVAWGPRSYRSGTAGQPGTYGPAGAGRWLGVKGAMVERSQRSGNRTGEANQPPQDRRQGWVKDSRQRACTDDVLFLA